MPNDKLLEIQNISLKDKKSDKPRFEDISFDIHTGEIVTFIGPSGSGKTSILESLNFINIPTSGKILYKGQDIAKSLREINFVRTNIAIVFQHFNLFPNKNVLKNVIYAAKITMRKTLRSMQRTLKSYESKSNLFKRIYAKEEIEKKIESLKKIDVKENAMRYMKELGILSIKDKYIENISGGQKQRVAIARALATNPDIILFDEPTSALDPESISGVVDIIKRFAKNGKTMILSTHQMKLAREVSDRILFLKDGKILQNDVPSKIFNSKNKVIKSFIDKIELKNKK